MVQRVKDHKNFGDADILGSAAESGTTQGSCMAGQNGRDRDARIGCGRV